jgi:hypothetical protein
VQLSEPGVGNYSSVEATIKGAHEFVSYGRAVVWDTSDVESYGFCEVLGIEEKAREGGMEQQRRKCGFWFGPLWRGTGFAGDERLNLVVPNELRHAKHG